MKRQINIAIMLLFLLVSWFFYNTVKISQTNLKISKMKFALKKEYFEIEKLKLENAQYQIVEVNLNGIATAILYDIKTGASFRISKSEDGIKWQPITYK